MKIPKPERHLVVFLAVCATLSLPPTALAADFTISTTDAREIAGVQAAAKQAGMTVNAYITKVVRDTLQSYAVQYAVDDPADLSIAKSQIQQLKDRLVTCKPNGS